MFAVSQGGGICIGAGNVCFIPPRIPIPFVNQAAPPNGTGFVPNIFMVTGMAHNQATLIPISTGDLPGVVGGVESDKFNSQAKYVECSTTVLMGGQPTPRLTSVTVQNMGNVPGVVSAPSQTVVLVLAP
jgi:hypothetical protein